MLQTAEARGAAAPRSIISDAEVEFFNTNGFVLPQAALPPEDTEKLKEAVERVFQDNPNWPNLLRMPHVPDRPGQLEGVKGGEHIFPFILHPVLIETARRLIGPNLIMWGAEIFAKPAGAGKRTPWHQDSYNPAIKAGPGRSHPRSVMIWIAVDRVDTENGCLRFIPSSQMRQRIEHEQFDKTDALLNFEVRKDSIDESKAVDAILDPGHFSGHDLFVVHGARPNNSGRRRAGITFHYMAAEDTYDRSFGAAKGSGIDSKPAPLAARPIWLVLGENKNPINDFVTGHQNLEDLDAMAEEARQRLTAQLG
jgi:hypothetical protein